MEKGVMLHVGRRMTCVIGAKRNEAVSLNSMGVSIVICRHRPREQLRQPFIGRGEIQGFAVALLLERLQDRLQTLGIGESVEVRQCSFADGTH